jgi:hypothetical protein
VRGIKDEFLETSRFSRDRITRSLHIQCPLHLVNVD